jgi:hypothetical protein
MLQGQSEMAPLPIGNDAVGAGLVVVARSRSDKFG